MRPCQGREGGTQRERTAGAAGRAGITLYRDRHRGQVGGGLPPSIAPAGGGAHITITGSGFQIVPEPVSGGGGGGGSDYRCRFSVPGQPEFAADSRAAAAAAADTLVCSAPAWPFAAGPAVLAVLSGQGGPSIQWHL